METFISQKKDCIYEGKAKKLFSTVQKGTLLVEYKNSFTAFNGEKKAQMEGKGRLNNFISSEIFEYLKQQSVPHHFIRKIDETHQLVKEVKILPIEVVVRNITTGSICKRLGIEEGMRLPRPLVEFYYKDDTLGDPIITEDHIILLGWGTEKDLATIKALTLKINDVLTPYFKDKNIVLVDFKLEFGKDADGNVILADEISPDTCRFWDSSTGDRLDKDRFRKDLGNVLQAYEEIQKRLAN